MVFIVFILLFLWYVLQFVGVPDRLPSRLIVYVGLVIGTLIFRYGGSRFMGLLLREWRAVQEYNELWVGRISRQLDHDKLLKLISPKMVRRYIFVLMGIAYILVNIESFGNVLLIPYAWWSPYKDVLVEVLLTLVTIDSIEDTVIKRDR